MLNLISLGDNSEKTISVKQLKDLSLTNMWIDVNNYTEEELKVLEQKFQVPASHLRPVEIGSYSGIHFIDEKIVIDFVAFREIVDPMNVIPIVFIFGKNFLLTIRAGDVPAIINSKKRMHKHNVDSPAYMVYTIIDEIITQHYNYLEEVEDRTCKLEESILENPQEHVLKDMFRLKTKLIGFNKVLWYERGVISSLRKSELGFIQAKIRFLFDSLLDDLLRQVNITETFREIISDGLDAYLSTLSTRMNTSIKNLTVVMLYLTVVTTITSFPNTIATIFGIPVLGMNTDWKIILLLLVLSTVIPVFWLTKKKWIKFE